MREKILTFLCLFSGIFTHVLAEQDTKALEIDVTKVTSTSVSLRRTSNSIARSAFNRVDLKMIGICDGISFNENCPCSHEVYHSLEKHSSVWLVKGLRPNFEYNATVTFGNFSTIIASDTFQFQTNPAIGLKLDDIVIKALANRSVQVVVTNLICARQSGSFDLDFEIEATNIPHKTFTADELASQLKIAFLMQGELLPGTEYKVCTLAKQIYSTMKFCPAITIPESAPFEPPSIEPYTNRLQNIVGFYIIAPPNYHSMKIKSYRVQIFSKCAILDQNCGKTTCEYQHFNALNPAFTQKRTYFPLNHLSMGTKYLIRVWAQNDLGLGDRPGAFEFQTALALGQVESSFVLSAGEDYVRVSIHLMCPYLGQDQFHILIQTQYYGYHWTIVDETDMEYHANSTTNSLSHTFNDLATGRKYQVCVRAQKDEVKSELSCKDVALRCTQLDQPTQSLSQVPWSVGKNFNPFTTVRLLIPANTFNGTGTGIKQYVVHCPAQYHWGQARDDDVYWNEDSIVDADLNKPGYQLNLAITAIACQNNQTTASISVRTETIPEFEPNAHLSHDSGVITIELEEDVRVIQYLSNFTTYLVGNLKLPLPKIFDPSQPYTDQNVSRSQFSFPEDSNVQIFRIERRISAFGSVATEIFYLSPETSDKQVSSIVGWTALSLLCIGLFGFLMYKYAKSPLALWVWNQRSTNVMIPGSLVQDMEVTRSIDIKQLAQKSFKSRHLESEFGHINRKDEIQNGSLTCSVALYWGQRSPSMNRYRNVLPFDASRVVLKTLVQSCDYINASWIQDLTKTRRYIAAQAPLDHTIVHFWQMVLDFQIKLIMMLTKTKENGVLEGQSVLKCARYWPAKEGSSITFGPIRITLEKLETIRYPMGLIKRTLDVSSRGNLIQVTQYQFTSWPDHGVPKDTSILLELQKILGRSMRSEPDLPVLIHCSAGVGRTGTLIAVNEMVFEMEKGTKQVDIAKFVFQMRQNRTNMVQQVVQYQYIYNCLAQFAASIGRNRHESEFYYYEVENDYYYE